VIGLPGETVRVTDGEVRVDGTRLDEPYVLPANNRGLFPGNSVSYVPAGSYFVLGDNRDNSYDSRSWGPLPQAYLHGSVEFIWFSFHWPEGLRAGRLGRWPK
jgi:signal peptidase I